MPHFILDCSENILKMHNPELLMQTVYDVAETSGLFSAGDIKVRITPYNLYMLGNDKSSFLHIFAYIMEGRTIAQKSSLSKSVITALNKLLPDVPIVSMNITDFEKSTYCNKSMV
jgi:5-carboxymethyl-2-hydroxymuconate isomerase